jgi:hypothetical protein
MCGFQVGGSIPGPNIPALFAISTNDGTELELTPDEEEDIDDDAEEAMKKMPAETWPSLSPGKSIKKEAGENKFSQNRKVDKKGKFWSHNRKIEMNQKSREYILHMPLKLSQDERKKFAAYKKKECERIRRYRIQKKFDHPNIHLHRCVHCEKFFPTVHFSSGNILCKSCFTNKNVIERFFKKEKERLLLMEKEMEKQEKDAGPRYNYMEPPYNPHGGISETYCFDSFFLRSIFAVPDELFQ